MDMASRRNQEFAINAALPFECHAKVSHKEFKTPRLSLARVAPTTPQAHQPHLCFASFRLEGLPILPASPEFQPSLGHGISKGHRRHFAI